MGRRRPQHKHERGHERRTRVSGIKVDLEERQNYGQLKRVSSPLGSGAPTPGVPWAGPFLRGTGRRAGRFLRSLSRLSTDLDVTNV